jgi:hypothetical protein
VLLPRLRVRLRDGDRLSEGSPALRRNDDHAGGRWTLEEDLPLLRREIGLSTHVIVLSLAAATTGAGHGADRSSSPLRP